jgi:hypothetical protein
VRIVQRLLALAGIGVVVWACVTSWGAVVHGHPLYAVLLGVTLLVSVVAGWLSFRPRPPIRGWRLLGYLVLALAGAAWIVAMAWLRPFTAGEPALTAMESTATVRVTETPTQVVLEPGLDPSTTGVVFQPGAKVEARAYAAILRPLVDAGFTVVIPKQPLGIGFLAMGAFESARDAFPGIERWVVAGHSLGGTVAAMDAEEHDSDGVAPVAGLLLYASYPASDMSGTLTSDVLSVSGSEDGLATPADIEESRAMLPQDTAFAEIDGAVHAFFGDYGPQPGDGSPTITQDDARAQIGRASVEFVIALTPR